MAKRLRPSGGYRMTASFQTATIIYDDTYWFCERFLDPRSRMADQMVQAARSGRQNIAEGSRAAATSSQTELRLLNVARASLEELLLDFEDFLRHRHLPQWAPDSPEAKAVRDVPRNFKRDRADQADLTDLTDQERWALYAPWLEHKDSAVRANALNCLPQLQRRGEPVITGSCAPQIIAWHRPPTFDSAGASNYNELPRARPAPPMTAGV